MVGPVPSFCEIQGPAWTRMGPPNRNYDDELWIRLGPHARVFSQDTVLYVCTPSIT